MGQEQHVSDVMTRDPASLDANEPVEAAARVMRDRDIGDVIVLKDGAVCGIVTDRDIVIRTVAEGRDPKTMPLQEICSQELVTLTPNSPVREAVDKMMRHAVRRLPVVENNRPVGIVSLGDLAVERDPESAVGRISSAEPNR